MLHSRLSKGLRLVAIFEAIKGTIVLALGFGLISMAGKDFEVLAEKLVGFLHLNPTFSSMFLKLASHMDNTQLWIWTGLAFAYSAVRFAEGYGLWYQRAWAEWFAALSAGLYIPVELLELIHRTTWIKAVVLASNIGIVALLVKVLVESRKAKTKDKPVTAPAQPAE